MSLWLASDVSATPISVLNKVVLVSYRQFRMEAAENYWIPCRSATEDLNLSSQSSRIKPISKQRHGVVDAVCDHGSYQASANQKGDSEHKTEQSCNNHTLQSLHVMTDSEGDAPEDKPKFCTTKVTLESLDNEGSLQFLLDATYYNGANDEKSKIFGGLYHFRKGIALNELIGQVNSNPL